MSEERAGEMPPSIRIADVSRRSVLNSSPPSCSSLSLHRAHLTLNLPSISCLVRTNQSTCGLSVLQQPLLALPWRRPFLTPAVP